MGNLDLKQWMSGIDDERSLRDIVIPGTHDSGTEKTGMGVAHCQNYNIERQLNDGIRFLDIRVSNINGGNDPLRVKHGIVNCLITFGDVLTWCKKIFKENNSETIIMLMDYCHDDLGKNIEEGFEKYLNNKNYKNLFYLGTTIPVLKDVRGKIVLFRRFESSKRDAMGIDLQEGWKDNDTFSLDVKREDGVVIEKFDISDEYKEHDTNKKVKVVQDHLSKKRSSDCFYIT